MSLNLWGIRILTVVCQPPAAEYLHRHRSCGGRRRAVPRSTGRSSPLPRDFHRQSDRRCDNSAGCQTSAGHVETEVKPPALPNCPPQPRCCKTTSCWQMPAVSRSESWPQPQVASILRRRKATLEATTHPAQLGDGMRRVPPRLVSSASVSGASRANCASYVHRPFCQAP